MSATTHFLHVLVAGAAVIFMLWMKTSSSESESLSENGKMMIRCIAEERKALLLFKQGPANEDDPLESWKKEEEDCCLWEGVGCDNHTNHVTQLHLSSIIYSSPYSSSRFSIGSSLLDLPYLYYLDLSMNFLTEIPEFIGSLTELVHLDLSHTYLGGSIPYQIGNLSNLQYLDLSSSYINSSIPKSIGSLKSLTHLDLSHTYIGGSIPYQIGNLSNLQYLDLSSNQINSGIPKSIGSLNSLTYLDLFGCQLYGVIPHELGNLSKLQHLDLSNNYGLTAGPAGNFEWLFSLSHATFIVLSTINISAPLSILSSFIQRISSMSVIRLYNCSLTGSIPHSFGNMTSLTDLDLSANQLYGTIPESFGTMTALTYLDLSSNQLYGMLPQSILNMSNLEAINFSKNNFTGSLPDFTQLSSLTDLYLSNNHLSGSLPAFTGFSSLKFLYLDNNAFSGSIPDFTGCSSLLVVKLDHNQLTEWKTQSFRLLPSFQQLHLSVNSIRSSITEAHLSNLSSLQYLNTSFNPLKFELNSEWQPPFQLSVLSLTSCKLGPKFPKWIQNQSELWYLDISNTQISDTIPLLFWNISSVKMQLLNLSSNKIRGKFSPKYEYIEVLDLSSNYFDGPLPAIPARSLRINLSQNKFSGTLVSLFVSEDLDITYLDISHNQLFGDLPDFWMHSQYLVFLNLGYNKITGRIPNSLGHLVSLQTLILRNNKLYGELPIALRNCSSLGFVDFGLNMLSGKVPSWIGKDLPNLYALILKSNRFYDRVPREICLLSKLHFLDLSINKISGTIPPCFNNLTAMIQKGTEVAEHSYATGSTAEEPTVFGSRGQLVTTSSYYDEVLARWKGHESEYGKNFAFLKLIDLSTNELTGEIPIEITKLVNLKGLNLSGNMFYGKVPLEIGRLKELECLDLSRNQFSGEIPASMNGLNFLAYLDLSNNNFTGRIPSGTQLQGFNISTYEGNTGLCGKPLTNICPGDEPNDHTQPLTDNGDDNTEYDRWFYVSLVLGFSTTFWGIIGTLVLNRRWRHAYFLILNNLKERLFVVMAVRIARLQR